MSIIHIASIVKCYRSYQGLEEVQFDDAATYVNAYRYTLALAIA